MAPKALYVDDERDICEIAEMCLKINDAFDARYVCSGQEALDIARDWKPDVILLDVMMPGMDGPTTVLQLKADSNTASIPVIFVTAKTLDSDLEALKQHAIAGVIAKPFQAMTLAEDVKRLISA